MIKNILFDFENIIVNVHGTDLLINNVLSRLSPEKRQEYNNKLKKFKVNDQVDSFQQFLDVVKVCQSDVKATGQKMFDLIDPNVKETIFILKDQGCKIFVFSSSFKDVIRPVTDALKLNEENVFANELLYDGEYVSGINKTNPLKFSLGNIVVVEKLKNEGRLLGSTAVVGNREADLTLRKNDIVDMFVYFTNSTMDKNIFQQADFYVERIEQLLLLFSSEEKLANKKLFTFSVPSDEEPNAKQSRILLLENVHKKAIKQLQQSGFDVLLLKSALDEDDLCREAQNARALGIRSKTHVTAHVIKNLKNLWTIGAYCIGTNQIDLEAAAEAGIPVFNAPYSNTRSVAELVVGETIMLMRRVFEKSSAAHQGKWQKSAAGSSEVRGKTIGIIGYGHIGSQVSVLLEHMGMTVIYYDIVDKLPLGNAESVASLYDLLERADIITLHVPDTIDTRGMIGETEIRRMKRGAYLINSSRGKVVNLFELKRALEDGHLAGAAVDVFPDEPNRPEDVFQSPLQNSSNVILTPHIGGSTKEAQENIAGYVSYKLEKYLTTGSTKGSINFPEIDMPRVAGMHRILHIHRNVPGVLAKINSVFARRQINVEAQTLQTKGKIGYLIVDVEQARSEQVLYLMQHITETIRARRIV